MAEAIRKHHDGSNSKTPPPRSVITDHVLQTSLGSKLCCPFYVIYRLHPLILDAGFPSTLPTQTSNLSTAYFTLLAPKLA